MIRVDDTTLPRNFVSYHHVAIHKGRESQECGFQIELVGRLPTVCQETNQVFVMLLADDELANQAREYYERDEMSNILRPSGGGSSPLP